VRRVGEERAPPHALDPLHDHDRAAGVIDTERVYRDDPRVLEPAGDHPLAQDRGAVGRGGVPGGLDGDVAFERVLAREEDPPHPALAEETEHLELGGLRRGLLACSRGFAEVHRQPGQPVRAIGSRRRDRVVGGCTRLRRPDGGTDRNRARVLHPGSAKQVLERIPPHGSKLPRPHPSGRAGVRRLAGASVEGTRAEVHSTTKVVDASGCS
jgi:hypothetical protein